MLAKLNDYISGTLLWMPCSFQSPCSAQLGRKTEFPLTWCRLIKSAVSWISLVRLYLKEGIRSHHRMGLKNRIELSARRSEILIAGKRNHRKPSRKSTRNRGRNYRYALLELSAWRESGKGEHAMRMEAIQNKLWGRQQSQGQRRHSLLEEACSG